MREKKIWEEICFSESNFSLDGKRYHPPKYQGPIGSKTEKESHISLAITKIIAKVREKKLYEY